MTLSSRFHSAITKALGSLTMLCSVAMAQPMMQQIPDLNGPVFAHKVIGDKVILGGAFTRVYNRDSSARFGAVTQSNGMIYGRSFPQPNDAVTTSLPDGNGGVFVGGLFTSYGDSLRSGLCHLDGNGKVTSLLAGTGIGNPVNALAQYGDTLFVGGGFLSAGKPLMNKPVAMNINLSNKLATPAFGKINGAVMCAVADGFGGWYLGGDFKSVNGISRNGLMRIDSLGNLYPFSPNLGGYARGLALYGDTLFVAGSFCYGGGLQRNNLVAINVKTGAALNWSPNPDGELWDIYLYNHTLYIAGTFSNAGGSARQAVAAFQLPSLTLKAWSATFNSGASLYSIYAIGNKVYVGGDYTTVKGTARNRIAALDSGAASTLKTWNAGTFNTYGAVFAIRSYTNKLFIGGNFTQINGTARPNFAVSDTANTFTFLGTNYNIDGSIAYLNVSGTKLYGCGYFNNINSVPSAKVFEMDINTFSFTSWNPPFQDGINHVCVSGNRLFCAYTVNTFGQTNTNKCLAAISLSTGAVIWCPTPNYQVYDLKIANGQLYVAGTFSLIGTTARVGACSFRLSDLQLTNFNPAPNNLVNSIEVDADSSVYLGGPFTTVGGNSRSYLAKVNGNTGALITSFSPAVNNNVNSVRLVGSRIWLGGNFTQVNAAIRNGFAVINKNNGSNIAWPNAPDYSVKKIIAEGNKAILIGSFSAIGTNPNFLYAAIVDTASGAPDNWRITPEMNIFSVTTLTGGIFVGTDGYLNGQECSRFAELDLGTGNITSWRPSFNAEVYDIHQLGNRLYVSGYFSSVGSTTKTGLASFDLSTKTLNSWNPVVSNQSGIYSITNNGSSLFFAGYFSQVNSVPRNFIANVDTLNGALLPFTVNVGSFPSFLQFYNNKLYVAGNFSSAGTSTRTGICAFNYPAGTLSAWNPVLAGGTAYRFLVEGAKARIWGDFTSVNSTSGKIGIVSVDTITGAFSGTVPTVNSSVTGYYKDGSQQYLIGRFSTVNGLGLQGFAKVDTFNNIQPYGFRFSPSGSFGMLAKIPGGLLTFVDNATINYESKKSLAGFPDQFFLPVTWIEFNVKKGSSPDVTELTWSTAKEINTASFEIQRLLSNGNFEAVGQLSAAGYSNHKNIYHFNDHLPVTAGRWVTYRIKQTDRDGKFSFSPERTLMLDKTSSTLVYPNPSNGLFKITSETPVIYAEIRDYRGSLIHQRQINLQNDFELEWHLPGIYFLTLHLSNGTKEVHKLISGD